MPTLQNKTAPVTVHQAYGPPGSRHIVCLTDGGSTEEEALEREDAPTSSHFRYIVRNSTPKAKPIAYGVGEFRNVHWTADIRELPGLIPSSSRKTHFPATLAQWDVGFQVGFLDRDYAAMMKSVLRGYQVTAYRAAGGFDNCVI